VSEWDIRSSKRSSETNRVRAVVLNGEGLALAAQGPGGMFFRTSLGGHDPLGVGYAAEHHRSRES